MNSLKIKIRLFLWSVLALSVIVLFCLKIVPGGEISYTYDFSRESRFITKLAPADRLGDIIDGSQRVIGNPVYFNFNAPRGFDEADVTITYKNTSNLAIIEAGILVDSLLWRYQMQPLENALINKLANEWDVLSEQGLILLQKPDTAIKYNSLDDFLTKLPPAEKIATYNYDLKADYRQTDYQPGTGAKIDTPLLGDWQLLTYLKDEDLYFSFDFYELGYDNDQGNIEMFLYYQGEIIESKTLAFDKSQLDKADVNLQTIDFSLAGLPEGVYKIELRAGRDVVTKNINTQQSKLVFSNGLEFLAGDNIPELVTDSRQIQFMTTDPGSFQEIVATTDAFSQKLNLNKTYQQFVLDGLVGRNKIILEKGGLEVSGDGVFAFSSDSFFNPRLKKADGNLNIKQDKIEYIIADYEVTGWSWPKYSATASFDLRNAYQEKNKYSFMISAPGLRADDDQEDSFEISQIKIDLRGKSIIEKIKSWFSDI